MSKTIMLVLGTIVLAFMLVSGCGQRAETTLNIGVATPLTGGAAYLGEHIQNAVKMAIDDQNEQGGVTIGEQKYTLNAIIRDTKMETPVGATVAEDLVFNQKVKVIAGPFIGDAIGVQGVTEPNKVLIFCVVPTIPGLCAPDKPYSFFCGSLPVSMVTSSAAYLKQFYPRAKRVASIVPDLPDTMLFLQAAKTIFPRYGQQWLGAEKFPADMTDFMPVITRTMAKKPDIIETSSTGGSLGALAGVLVKQIREAGFKGIIALPAPPPRGTLEKMVSAEHLTKVVCGEVDWESPIVAKSYRDLINRYAKKFNITPNPGIIVSYYSALKALFECIDGKDSLDTATWIEAYGKYRWQSPWEKESYWTGKKMFGIDRIKQQYYYVSEFTNGKLETKWEAPIANELLN